MKNILSYGPYTKIRGNKIKEWIIFHMEHETSHTSDARKMKKYLNIDDDKYYYIRKGDYQASERYYCVINAEN